ncbi:MAG: hypothetical protein GY865_05595 [candidate division Zixibacteria bacterium]|nr:hypothetical protein [candidate division Zixibacteria bacterium]
MKQLIVLLSVGAIILIPLSGLCDDTSILQPYGFRLPFMEKGEYIISLNYYNYSSRATTDYNTPDYSSSKYDDINIALKSTIALSKKLLIQSGVVFYPNQISSEYRSYVYNDYLYDDKQKSYMRPNFLVVFRPTRSLEIWSEVEFGNRKTDYLWLDGTNPETYQTRNSYKFSIFSAGITFHGQL